MPNTNSIASTFATIIAFCATTASAAIIVTTDATTNNTNSLSPTYAVSSTDLINGLSPTASAGNFTIESSGGLPVLTDGAFPDPLVRGDHQQHFADGGGAGGNGGQTVTYTLGQASNLEAINVYGGWQDGGRDQQLYDVFYSTADNPAVFLPLASVNFNPPAPSGSFPQATFVSITTDDGSLLASNVAALRFDFGNPENLHTGYGEIDVLGYGIPEPTTALLCGLGLCGLIVTRRRRRR